MTILLHSPFREIVGFAPSVARSSFYEGYFAQFYSGYTSMITTDIDWYFKKAGSNGKLRILDMFCGNGRIAQFFSSKGHVCTAIEQSPDMLAQGGDIDSDVETILGDVFDHLRPATYDVVVAGQMSVAMFGDPRNRGRLLEHVLANLKPGGRFLFDMPVRADTNTSEVFALPLLGDEQGYMLVGVFRDVKSRIQTTHFLAEIDRKADPTVRILAGHELVLLSEDELRQELASHGFRIEEMLVTPMEASQPDLSASVARIVALKAR